MTYTMLLNFTVHSGANEASTVWTMNTNYANAYKTKRTGSLWPWRGCRACRSGLHDSRMTWQPSAHV
jgi:hypothetical protein